MTTKTPIVSSMLSGLPTVNVSVVLDLQGNLKSLPPREYKKLKKSIVDNGIIFPLFVWKEGNTLIDGHQRVHIAKTEGWDIDWPVVYVSAPNVEKAKELLLLASSQYGLVTKEGWAEFSVNLNREWVLETVNFDALPVIFNNWEAETSFLDKAFAGNDSERDGKGWGGGEYDEDDDDDDDDEDEKPDNSHPYVGLSFTATEAQRNRVLIVINKIKAQKVLKTSTDALLALCDFYEAGNK